MGPTSQEMDPQGTDMMSSDNAGVYNMSEIWPGYEMNPGSTTTSPYGLALDHPMDHQRLNQHTSRNVFSKQETSTTNVHDNNHVHVVNESNGKRQKEDENSGTKVEMELVDSGKVTEQSAKPVEQLPKQAFIHVRARRGQATDSHSLAERARREKISEKMKILQDLVPGCNKVMGKALVLDEIINYIQSLQHQVEFLSLKLETVNARGIYGYPSKDFAQQPFDTPGMQFGAQSGREYVRGSSPEWLDMQLGGGFARSS